MFCLLAEKKYTTTTTKSCSRSNLAILCAWLWYCGANVSASSHVVSAQEICLSPLPAWLRNHISREGPKGLGPGALRPQRVERPADSKRQRVAARRQFPIRCPISPLHD